MLCVIYIKTVAHYWGGGGWAVIPEGAVCAWRRCGHGLQSVLLEPLFPDTDRPAARFHHLCRQTAVQRERRMRGVHCTRAQQDGKQHLIQRLRCFFKKHILNQHVWFVLCSLHRVRRSLQFKTAFRTVYGKSSWNIHVPRPWGVWTVNIVLEVSVFLD